MSPEAQRVAIAEACGWKNIHVGTTEAHGYEVVGLVGYPPGIEPHFGAACQEAVPDYLNELNAMHRTEASLTDEQRAKFVLELHFATEGDLTAGLENAFDCTQYIFPVLHATAAERAKAFLRTVGKWEDEQ